MKTETVNGYHVAGNEHLAIAINVTDPTDAHHFTPRNEGDDLTDMNAWDCAIAWTAPGLGPNDPLPSS